MATQSKLDLKGLEEYLERIAKAGHDVDESAARAVLAGAEVTQEGMRSRVAVDTGNLSEHIQIKGPEQDGNTITCEVGVIYLKEWTDADTARYGNTQEYGSSKMPAHPYIRPTLKNDRKKILQAERESLERDEVL